MNSSPLVRYGLVAALALAPIGLRLATWRSHRPQNVDVAMAQEGEKLFVHEWKPNDPLANGGDGLGPVFNAKSCVACHFQGGAGGSGGLEHNVLVFTVQPVSTTDVPREGVVHAGAFPASFQEKLSQVNINLPNTSMVQLGDLIPVPNCGRHPMRFPQGIHLSHRNTPALFGANLIDAIPDRVIIAQERTQWLKLGMASPDREDVPVGRALRLANGRVGHFGWKAQSDSLLEFVQAACANELGLSNPGHPQPSPIGYPSYEGRGPDLTLDQCEQLSAYIASLPRPVERTPDNLKSAEMAHAGKALFTRIGCAECHTPNLGEVEGLYSDLLLHQMGELLVGGGSYGEPPLLLPKFKPAEGPVSSEWRTPPLWGVADSAPYMHDGRAKTLEEAIRFHGGQGLRSAQSFTQLGLEEQSQLVTFLKVLRAP
ncbi:MAG TPA: di-heme oxidoredictase family protein [Gemmataceae bacterium]|jgi:CxxC motif-containing protein (DUF1111 family)|nr:di-heme oxidoredictase family protein [Gemmataceae bacterium]